MKRRRLLLALGAALAVLVAAVWWALLPRPGITEANCARIKPGMQLEEVESILGSPPEGVNGIGQFGGTTGVPSTETWVGEEGLVVARLHDDGTVTDARFIQGNRPSLLERLRHRLGF